MMARLGCLDRDLVVEAIAALVPWKSRMRLMARFLSMAMISGPLAVRSWWWSSPVTTSLTDLKPVLYPPVPADPGRDGLGPGLING